MKIAVVNASTRVSDEDLQTAVEACWTQLRDHFCPAWDMLPPSDLLAVPRGGKPPAGALVVTVMDTPDDPGALGYHSEQGDQVYGRIFASPVLDNGGAVLMGQDADTPTVASVLSHELMELTLDPFCDFWVDGPSIDQGSCYALESADPVQGFGYQVTLPPADGSPGPAGAARANRQVAVSDFVLPAWFDDQATPGTKVDFLARCVGAFQLGEGGYMVVREAPGTEKQVLAARPPPAWRAQKPGSRPAARLGGGVHRSRP